MAELATPPLSLYVHFPWCVQKCPYCDFNSYTLQGDLAEHRYVEALQRDLETQATAVQGREVISIFLGGGTPSLFSPEGVGSVLAAARRHLVLAADVEVTMEANPGAVEHGRFADYRAAGINRVSLGAQSFDAARLKVLGRIHSPGDTRRAAEELHAAGLDNFNLDLMYALPDQDVVQAERDIEAALALQPAHISHYQLTLEPGTVFAARPPALPEDDVAAEMLTACAQRLAESGFAQYEVSAYARVGRQCRHNRNYWTFGDYLGIGAGAHGKLTLPEGILRTTHTRDPRRYLAQIPAEPTREAVAAADLAFEFMLNALRLRDGFDISVFSQRTGRSWREVAATVENLCQRGLLAVDGERVCTTELGLRFLNDLLLSFLAKTPKSTGAFGLSTVV